MPAKSAVSRSAWAWISGISGTASTSGVVGALADVGEHGVEGAEDRLRVEQPLLVAEQPDVPVDERLLGVQRAGRDGDGRVPASAPCARAPGSAAPAPKRAAPSATWRWYVDVALRAVGHDLGDADLVVVGERAQRVVGRDDARSARRSSRG